MRYLLILLLTGCVSYKDRTTGEWTTVPLFWGSPEHSDTRLTVHVVDRDTLDKVCAKWGYVAACTVNRIAYVQGEPQVVTMKLSSEYINNLPINEGRAGDMLAEKLGLDLGFNSREDLGHEFRSHVLGYGHG